MPSLVEFVETSYANAGGANNLGLGKDRMQEQEVMNQGPDRAYASSFRAFYHEIFKSGLNTQLNCNKNDNSEYCMCQMCVTRIFDVVDSRLSMGRALFDLFDTNQGNEVAGSAISNYQRVLGDGSAADI